MRPSRFQETECQAALLSRQIHADRANGEPTFLKLDRPYPNQVFTALIWGEERPRFEEPPERRFRGRRICVTGKIGSYRGVPQIIVRGPDQIEIVTVRGGG